MSPTQIRDIQQSRRFTLNFDISAKEVIPFAVIDQSLRALVQAGVFPFRLESPVYRFLDPGYPPVISPAESHLFYSVLFTEESDLIQLVGSDPSVIPPKLDLDITRLRKLIPEAGSEPKVLFFTMFVSEKGSVRAVESPDRSAKAAVNMLKQVPVLVPGRREGINVATAVLIAIPTK